MVITLLIVAAVVVSYAVVLVLILRRWWAAPPTGVPAQRQPVRTPIDYDPDNRHPFQSGDGI